MVSSASVSVSTKSWMSPNVTVALGVEEESVKAEIQLSALVMSGELEDIAFVAMFALITLLCVLCVAVCTSATPGCVNGDNM